jgi:hypothetical protein
MELPKNEATFEVDIVGDTTFKQYQGQFTCRCVLSMGQKHSMELEKSRLLGSSVNKTDELEGMAVIFATIRAKIIDSPEWWKQSLGGSSINDENALMAVFDNVEKAEKEWRQKVKDLANPPAPVTDSLSPNQ